MEISNVEFKNFKPYYGKVSVDLSVKEDQNVILIGGRNGHGKTQFLVGVVWCLYGANIATVDKVFKDEVKGNYTKFLSKSLNKTAAAENISEFSVKVTFGDVELSDVFTKNEQRQVSISLKRTYDLNSASPESFEILMDNEPNSLLADDADKANFVNDYLIPIELAKFVFFDAEKIAEIAQLGAKDQASLMDEAFGQILGLNVYDNLVEDLKQYERGLQKEAASSDIAIQIKTYENEKERNKIRFDDIEQKINENDERIDELKLNITEYTNQLIRRGDTSLKVDINELRKSEEALIRKKEELNKRFNEASEIIPFVIMAGKIEEVLEQIDKEEKNKISEIEKRIFKEKTKEFTEQLFNKPNFPDNDIDVEQKFFYSNKARKLLQSFYSEENTIDIEFEHDLDKSDIIHLKQIYELVKQNSTQVFESMFTEYMRIQNDFQEITKKIKSAEASTKDEFIQDIHDNKKNAEIEKTKLEQQKGKYEADLIQISESNNKIQLHIDRHLARVKTSKEKESQIKIVRKYIKALKEFIKDQKEEKKKVLEKNLLKELNSLLTKKGLVNEVEIIIHKSSLGLEVTLFDSNGDKTNPATDMSKGEQQLYISALLKSILTESIHDLPVLIDTPLGRLDQEHRNNILEYYYPYLSKQVIIFSTNTEIRGVDIPNIERNIAKKYLLENVNKKTSIKKGYFNS